MPRVNIYIRNDDWEAWQNIPDKPEWIHEGLTTGFVMIPAKSVYKKNSDRPSDENIRKAAKALDEAEVPMEDRHFLNLETGKVDDPAGLDLHSEAQEQATAAFMEGVESTEPKEPVKTPRNRDTQFCKHGYARQLCKHAECRK